MISIIADHDTHAIDPDFCGPALDESVVAVPKPKRMGKTKLNRNLAKTLRFQSPFEPIIEGADRKAASKVELPLRWKHLGQRPNGYYDVDTLLSEIVE